MTQRTGARPKAVVSLVVAAIAGACLVFVVYLILTTHPTGFLLYRDVAFLVIYGCAAFVWTGRYREFSTGPKGDGSN